MGGAWRSRGGADADVPVEPKAAAAAPYAGEERQGRADRPASHRVAGAGRRAAGGGSRGDARRHPADHVQLARTARGCRRTWSASGSKRPGTAQRVDRAGAALPGVEHGAAPGGAGVRVGQLDDDAPAEAPGEVGWVARVGHDVARAVAPPRVRVEAPTLRAATRSRPREKNAESSGKSGIYRRDTSCSRRTRPTCGCSLLFGRRGPGAASRPGSG